MQSPSFETCLIPFDGVSWFSSNYDSKHGACVDFTCVSNWHQNGENDAVDICGLSCVSCLYVVETQLIYVHYV